MIPLGMVMEGEEIRINQIYCGKGLRSRLYDLGIYDGSIIKIIKNDVSGPVILKIKDSKIVLGRGQAQQVMVEIVENSNKNG